MNLDLSDHIPGRSDPDGFPRCQVCGFRHPCPAVRLLLPQQTEDERRVVELISTAWSIWRAIPIADGWSDADPVGGTVVGWWDDDGGHRIYRVLDFPRGRHRYRTIPVAEVDPAAAGLPNSATIRRQVRRLCAEIAATKGVVTQAELGMLEDALTLMKVIA